MQRNIRYCHLPYSYIFLALQPSTAAPAAAPSSSASKVKAPVAKAAASDDFDDLFGADDEDLNDEGETAEEAAATKARQARMVSLHRGWCNDINWLDDVLYIINRA